MRRERLVPPLVATLVAVVALLLAGAPAPIRAGGFIQKFVPTGEPSPIPGQVIVEERPVRWDARCLPAPFVVDDGLDPLPNPLGEDFLSLAEVVDGLRFAADQWNDIPTSYVGFEIGGTRSGSGVPTDNHINEITFQEVFPGATFLGATSVLTLEDDAQLADGDDIDGDGDADVSAAIATCQDVDGDGDTELPAGFYPATTILESDQFYNPTAVRYTVDIDDIDVNGLSFDLPAIVVHELGHSVGLAHSPTSQVSPADGAAATMFPFLSGFSPDSELGERSLAPEELGLTSMLYPEGTAATGPAALQPGDLAFDEVYGVIEGEITHGPSGLSIMGANVVALDRFTDEVAASVYAGGLRASQDPETGGLFLFDLDDNFVGSFRLPVPKGEYEVAVEPVDGSPISPFSAISLGAQLSFIFGLMDFPEEAFHEGQEATMELFPGRGTPVPMVAGQVRTGVDLVTNLRRELAKFALPPSLFGFVTGPPGAYLAQEIPAEMIAAADTGDRLVVHSGNFFTLPLDPANVPIAAEAMLTTGRILEGGLAEVDVDQPLARVTDLVAQDLDLTPVFFQNPVALGERVREVLASGSDDTFFLVLRVPEDDSVPVFNLIVRGVRGEEGVPDGAYFSLDGETFFDAPIPIPMYFTLTLSGGSS